METPHPGPPLPEGCPSSFRVTVHGTVFAGRDVLIGSLAEGDPLLLVADPRGQDEPQVWVHVTGGDPLGHLPPEVSAWLCPWMWAGGRPRAVAVRVRGSDVPSWRRVLVEVACGAPRPGEGG